MSVLDDLTAQATTPQTSGSSALGILQTLAQVGALNRAGQGGGGGGGGGFKLPAGGSATLRQFLNIARKQVGDPYVYASEGPSTFDCSGLVAFALQHAGVNVPRMSAAGYQQMFNARRVGHGALRPGDLMFYYYPNSRGIGPGSASHIDIYLGHGRSVGASGSAVHVSPVNWSNWIGAARVPQLLRGR